MAGFDAPGLRENLCLLSAEERDLARLLSEAGQARLFEAWAGPGEKDEEKHGFFGQVQTLHANYPGGLPQYLSNARALLGSAARGENPLEGWTPSVPTSGVKPEIGTEEHCQYEAAGLDELAHCCFVIPAGGLGERLGFAGVKLALPAETTSGCSVLGLYAAYIRSFERLAEERGSCCQLPLVIMVSSDTLEGTKELLRENSHFGLAPSQVQMVVQEKVAALSTSAADLAMDTAYRISTKPHGHGDVHFLLRSHGIVERWIAEGRRWIYFLQDSSTLYFSTFLCSLGVSAKHSLHVNSVAMPRRAKEAVGAIAQLRHADGRSIVVNVEYNQLEPMLLATGHAEGDVDGPDGFSPYPGNTNGLVFSLPEYAAQLEKTGGRIAEFVNPKYRDASRTEFKAPTRLECMMQDYPKLLPPEARVGFTLYAPDFGYFPCKNDIATAARLSAAGLPPHGAASAEAAVYRAHCRMLELLGAHVGASREHAWRGGKQSMPPTVLLWPSFSPCFSVLKQKLPCPDSIRIATGSSLEVSGEGVCIEELDLDGAVSISAAQGVSLRVVRLVVRNRGHEFVALSDEEQAGLAPEELQLRGYKLLRHETEVFDVREPGSYTLADGELIRCEGA